MFRRFFRKTQELVPPETVRRLSMCPFLEAWSGGNAVIFARRTDVGRVSYAWFVLAAEDAAVEDCELRIDESEDGYRRFLERAAVRVRLERVTAEQAKTRVFHAVWRSERAGRLPPRLFALPAGLMDGVQIIQDDLPE